MNQPSLVNSIQLEPAGLDRVEGSVRALVGSGEVSEGKRQGWLVADPQRRRTRYFDGLLLKAGDLTRDQAYFLARQADLGRLAAGGVVHGLEVLPGANAASLMVARGHGVTPSGELVVLERDTPVDFVDVAKIQGFDAIFGLEVRPDTPMRNRGGLFVLALRRVEFTANPVASYPQSLGGERKLEDGDIIEATAVTLIPFEEVAVADVRTLGRARLAHEVFVRGAASRLSRELLPLAVVALERGEIVWVDAYLLRRDRSTNDGIGFDRSVREAFLRQYTAQLRDVRLERADSGASGPWAALDYFQALPAFGPLPLDAVRVEGQALVQTFFPAELGVELGLVPDDELPLLAEEAMALPPFDLTADASSLEDAPISILIPVPRVSFTARVAELEGKLTRQPRPRAARPNARLTPIALLDVLRRRHRDLPVATTAADLLPWEAALAAVAANTPAGQLPVLYYVRRPRLARAALAASRFQTLPPDSPEPTETLGRAVRERLITAGELDAPEVLARATHPLDFMLRGTSNEVARALEALFATPACAPQRTVSGAGTVDTRILVNAVVQELAYRTRVRLDDLIVSEQARSSVIAIAGEVIAPIGAVPTRVRALSLEDVARTRARFRDLTRGDGIALLTSLQPTLAGAVARDTISRSLRVPELDGTALALADATPRQAFAAELLRHALAGDINAIRDMVDARFGPVVAGPDEERYEAIPGFPGSDVAVLAGEGRLYHLVHSVANDAVKNTVSQTLARPFHNVRFIVSSFLAHLLSEGWDLALDDAGDVGNVLVALAAWDRGELYAPSEARSNGSQLNQAGGDAASVLTAYGAIQGLEAAFRQSLEARLSRLGDTLDVARIIAFAGTSAGQPTGIRVIAKLFEFRNDAQPTRQNQLLDALKAAADARNLNQIRTLLR